jgi:nanoRNase/pAp phosphatase (c-di-AMP/oligoRNAs hydrolase)
MLNLEQQIFKQIDKSKNILIVLPKNPDGDALSAALAFYVFFKKEQKQVSLASVLSKESEVFSFLPEYSSIEDSLHNVRRFIVSLDISQAKVSQIKYAVDNNRLDFIISPSEGWFRPEDVSTRAGEFKYDLIITVGVSELESIGSIYDQNIEFFYKTTIINIDNQASNEDFGQINFIDLNSVAVSEIAFYLIKNYKPENISPDIATCLLTGIIHKTKNFKNTNLTPRTLLASSELISHQARREEIIGRLYRSRDIKTLRLWGKFLSHLQSENNESLIWSKIRSEQFKKTGTSIKNLDDVIDELIITVPQASLVVVFCEKNPQETDVILYSLKNINALEALSGYTPKGSSRVASITINQDMETASTLIIPDIKRLLEKLSA